MSRPRWLPALLVLCGILLPLLMPPFEAAAAAPGDLLGYLTGPNNIPVTGARVTLSRPEEAAPRTQLTDAQGFFRFVKPTPGAWRIAVEADGYAPFERAGIEVSTEETTRLSIRLTPSRGGVGLVTELATPRLEPSVLSTTLRDGALSSLLPDVTSTGLLYFTPGYHDDVVQPDFSAPVVRGPSFHGASPAENRYRLDGLDVTSPLSGAPGLELPLEFLEQVTVRTAGSSSPLGDATGAQVEVGTRYGGNRFHGGLFFYLTPYQQAAEERLEPQPEGADPLGRRDVPLISGQAGLSLGGYLLPDRIWFFLGAAFRGELGQVIQRIGTGETQLVNSGWRVPLTLRLTFNLTPDQTLQLSAYGTPGQEIGVLEEATDAGTGLAGDPSTLRGVLEEQAGALSVRYALRLPQYRTRADLLIGAFGQRRWTEPYPGDLTTAEGTGDVPQVVHVGLFPVPYTDCDGEECLIANYRTGSLGELHEIDALRAVADLTVSHRLRQLAGEHLVRWGGSLRLDTLAHRRRYTGDERIYDHSLEDPPYSEAEFLVDPETLQPASQLEDNLQDLTLSGWLADTWNPFRSITVELGVRVDSQRFYHDGSQAMSFWPAVSPHAGLSYGYRLGRLAGRLVAGYRREAAPLPTWIADAALLTPMTAVELADTTSGDEPLAGSPLPGAGRAAVAIPASQYYTANDARLMSQNTYAGGVSQSLGRQFVFAAHVLYRDLVTALEPLYYPNGVRVLGNPGVAPGVVRNNIELDTCFTMTSPLTGEPEQFCYQTPVRSYQAVELRLDRVPRDQVGLWLSAAYTLSRLEGDYPGPVPQPAGQDPLVLTSSHQPLNLYSEALPERRVGPLPADRTHRIRFTTAVDLPGGLRAGVGILARSGVPRDVAALSEDDRGGLVLLFPRGAAGRTPWVIDQAVSLGYELRFRESRALSLVATVFNPLQLSTAIRNDPRYVLSLAEPSAESGFDPTAPAEVRCVDPLSVTTQACVYNSSFDQPLEVQAPPSVRLMARYSF